MPRMRFDIDQLDPARSYKLLTATVVPRPIAWVVSADAAGLLNAAPYSFFNCFGGHPPVVGIGLGRHKRGPKDTLANIHGARHTGAKRVGQHAVPDQRAIQRQITGVVGHDQHPPRGWNILPAESLDTEVFFVKGLGDCGGYMAGGEVISPAVIAKAAQRLAGLGEGLLEFPGQQTLSQGLERHGNTSCSLSQS